MYNIDYDKLHILLLFTTLLSISMLVINKYSEFYTIFVFIFMNVVIIIFGSKHFSGINAFSIDEEYFAIFLYIFLSILILQNHTLEVFWGIICIIWSTAYNAGHMLGHALRF